MYDTNVKQRFLAEASVFKEFLENEASTAHVLGRRGGEGRRIVAQRVAAAAAAAAAERARSVAFWELHLEKGGGKREET